MFRYTVGRVQAAEGEMEVYGPLYERNKTRRPPIIHLHGGANLSYDVANQYQWKLMKGLAARGHHILSQDLGSATHWGNALAQARTLACKTFSQGTLGNKAGKCYITGISMGGQLGWNWARANPDKVLACALIIPALSIDYDYQNNVANQQGSIAGAHGIVYPAPLPAGIDPTTSGPSTVPTKIYIVTDDVYTPINIYTMFKNMSNVEYLEMGALGHTGAAIAAAPSEDILNFFERYPV